MIRETDPDVLLHLYVDGELDEADARAFEARMEEDDALASRVAATITQTEMLRAELPDPSPEHLARLMAGAEGAAFERRSGGLRLAASVALLAFGAAGGFGAAVLSGAAGGGGLVAPEFTQSATAAHALYTAEVLHPVEVAAGERAHLDGWLSKRLGAEISAPELTGFGYGLVGGRLLPFEGQGAAQFMYESGSGARLTLYAVTIQPPDQSSFRFREADGLMAVSWQEGIWHYALVGAQTRAEMEELARFIHGSRL